MLLNSQLTIDQLHFSCIHFFLDFIICNVFCYKCIFTIYFRVRKLPRLEDRRDRDGNRKDCLVEIVRLLTIKIVIVGVMNGSTTMGEQ